MSLSRCRRVTLVSSRIFLSLAISASTIRCMDSSYCILKTQTIYQTCSSWMGGDSFIFHTNAYRALTWFWSHLRPCVHCQWRWQDVCSPWSFLISGRKDKVVFFYDFQSVKDKQSHRTIPFSHKCYDWQKTNFHLDKWYWWNISLDHTL